MLSPSHVAGEQGRCGHLIPRKQFALQPSALEACGIALVSLAEAPVESRPLTSHVSGVPGLDYFSSDGRDCAFRGELPVPVNTRSH